jgi:FKBP-type peptidyl-prolyl cis-trans isomerase FkpA
MKYFIPLFVLSFIFSSCNKEKRQAKKDEDIISKYISNNHLNAVATGTGLYYVIDVVGTGAQPNASSQVTVAYKGYFTDGSVFDESNAAGLTFGLSGVIKGWTEGIPYFRKGGKGKLLIPSKLGYGPDGTNGIPGNSVLIFDINLIDVI